MAINSNRASPGAADNTRNPPWIDLLLAAAGVAPFLVCALIALSVESRLILLAQSWTVVYGGGLLCFLGGVRRGLSFRQAGGPTSAQLTTMASLFFVGLIVILLPWHSVSLLVLACGLAGVMVFDVLAARREEVPRYFHVLRPIQMTVAVAAVLVVLARFATASSSP